MDRFNPESLRKLYIPASNSHKGQNGKLLIIAGSTLFHAASLWPLMVASRMLDMVFYSSVPENNEIVQKAKEEFRNGIVVRRNNLDSYVKEADCILIGPGLPRKEGESTEDDDTKELTERLLKAYPDKKWVIDGGSLQVIDPNILLKLEQMPILTPHHGEFKKLFNFQLPIFNSQSIINEQFSNEIQEIANKFRSVILLKGEVDVIASPGEVVSVSGGNAGMTKGGTGDVLAGLTASLYCKNDDPFLVACAASHINKKAGESLEKSMGIYFNATDLASEIPKIMKELL
ncbi:MAG: NAD(P)H-hydrate dehydratase [Candidatus Levybacteria bacterium]|nr:NAD(P)H-hydrate dehydratase [Candidatus Levybacteria bacterium]MBP9815180.1 NAD(P)H-hydrate dehydratase [Candidatus Levybacteria bacterium]